MMPMGMVYSVVNHRVDALPYTAWASCCSSVYRAMLEASNSGTSNSASPAFFMPVINRRII